MNGPTQPCACGGTLFAVSVTRDTLRLTNQWTLQCQWCGLQLVMLTPDLLFMAPDQAPAEPAPESIPVIHGSVIGYRAWRIREWQLVGSAVNRAWVPGVNEATCDPGPADPSALGLPIRASYAGGHPAPAHGCHCGITALARFDRNDHHWAGVNVVGAIEAWSDESEHGDGRFILHRNGFRAQFGKVILLAVDDDWPAAKKAAVRALAAEHGADVCRFGHLEDAAKEHGQLVPEHMLEWAGEIDSPEVSVQGYARMLPAGPGTWQWQTCNSTNWQTGFAYQQPGGTVQQKDDSLKALKAAARKGIKRTLGVPGPPGSPVDAYRKGDRVKDSRGAIWRCVKHGKPGRWEREE